MSTTVIPTILHNPSVTTLNIHAKDDDDEHPRRRKHRETSHFSTNPNAKLRALFLETT